MVYDWVFKPGGFYIPRSCETNKKFQSYAKSYEEPKAARVSKLLIHFLTALFYTIFKIQL